MFIRILYRDTTNRLHPTITDRLHRITMVPLLHISLVLRLISLVPHLISLDLHHRHLHITGYHRHMFLLHHQGIQKILIHALETVVEVVQVSCGKMKDTG